MRTYNLSHHAITSLIHFISLLLLYIRLPSFFFFFFFNDTATTEIYTLSLHDALPICRRHRPRRRRDADAPACRVRDGRSEEHTSELQSRSDLVCRLLLEKKKNNMIKHKLYRKYDTNYYVTYS